MAVGLAGRAGSVPRDPAAGRESREEDVAWAFVRLAFASPARLAIVPVQDVLGLGSEARMNRPGSASGNWRWRLSKGALTTQLAGRLQQAAAQAGRLKNPPNGA